MADKIKGTLIIIGGHEDKTDGRAILTEVARTSRVERGPLVIVTAATQEPEELAEEYSAIFKDLGVKQVAVLDIRVLSRALMTSEMEQPAVWLKKPAGWAADS